MKKHSIFLKIICPVMKGVLMQVFIAFAFSLVALAYDTNAQELLDKKITLKVEDQQVKNVLSKIEKQAEIKFMYTHEIIRANRKVSISAADERLEDVLRKLLEPLKITYEVSGKRILLSSPLSEASPGTKTESQPLDFAVSGKVTDNEGQAVPGVSVVLKGTTNGIITNAEGRYSLNAPDGTGTLVFSFIGYLTEEVAINNQSVINVTMIGDLKSLEEVVVVGYGTQRQREVTGAIGSVTSKDINGVAVTGLDQALQGKLAGVQVTQNSGAPGGGVSIRIRGVGSINGSNEPLYIVDGVPYGSLNAINPNDIDRIDVLKDAASAAIYGSRGTNGVVLVTTKRAKAGKVTVNVDAYAGTQSAYRTLDVLNGPQFAKLANENLVNGGQAPNPAWSNPSTVASTDWQKELFKTKPIQSYNVSIAGGNEKSRSILSVGYFDQGGIVSQSYYNRYTARLNSDYEITKNFKVGVTLNASFDERRGTNTDGNARAANTQGGLITTAISHPTLPLTTTQTGLFDINPNGSINAAGNTYYGFDGTAFVANSANTNYYPAGLSNPVYAYEKQRNIINKSQQFLAAVFGEYEIVKGLKARSAFNLTLSNDNGNDFSKSSPDALNGRGLYSNQGRYSENWGRGFQWNWINTLSYSKTIEKHNFSVIAGVDALRSNFRGLSVQTQKNPNDQQFIDGSLQNDRLVFGGAPNEFALVSYIARLTYDYAGKYLLTANIRRDGSSSFGPSNKYGFFPSASVGWLVSEEDFLKSLPFISQLKVRASYGTVGNQGIPPFQYLSSYGNEGNRRRYALGTNQDLLVGTFPVNTGNADIRWEKSVQTNIGVDAAFLDNKFTLTADYYVKNISDMLGNFPVPAYMGVANNSLLKNGFSMQNSGIEIALGYNQRIGEVNFSASANFSTLANKVTKLTDNETGFVTSDISAGDDGGASTRTQLGQRIGNFYGYVADGIIQNASEATSSGMVKVKPGDRRYKNLDTARAINDKDRMIIGNGLPKYIFGLNLSADYKGFDISVLLNGQAGVQIANQTKFWLSNMRYENNQGGISNVSTDVLNSWTGPGTSNTLTRNAYDAAPSNKWFSTFNIENGAFLRVRNVQLGYTLPEALSRKIGMSRARIYVAAQNLFTFTKYSGYDPELGSRNGNALQTGVDFGRYPVARMFMGGVNFQF